jgi:hypothetical protein
MSSYTVIEKVGYSKMQTDLFVNIRVIVTSSPKLLFRENIPGADFITKRLSAIFMISTENILKMILSKSNKRLHQESLAIMREIGDY